MSESMLLCPLCCTSCCTDFYRDKRRRYWRCQVCFLVFVAPEQHLLPQHERAEYEKHENNPDDEGYRRFLSRLADPLIRYFVDSGRDLQTLQGLDFGCGPGPTLSLMLQDACIQMRLYDPFFAPDTSVLSKRYDLVTATEVFEHLCHPRRDLPLLWQTLAPGAVLGVMTKLVIDVERFAQWHYKNDPTHVIFFSRETLLWLAKQWSAEIRFCADDTFLMIKPKTSA